MREKLKSFDRVIDEYQPVSKLFQLSFVFLVPVVTNNTISRIFFKRGRDIFRCVFEIAVETIVSVIRL